MAQPSLSEQIRRLEAELGVALFARVGRGITLTEAGRLLRRTPSARWRPPARRPSRSRKCATSRGGTATFGTFGSAHYYLLVGLIQDFRARHPNVRVRAIGQNSSEVADAVREGAARGRDSSRSRSTTAGSTSGPRCARSSTTSAPTRSACASR